MLSSPIDEIKNRLDIVDVIGSYIKLQKAGANYRAVCPFHSEKKPSFFVSPVRQIWHCFGACSEGGDIFKFVMKIEGVEFGDALRILAQKAGIELKREDPKLTTERQRLYEISELACCFFEKQLNESPTGQEAKKYLIDRGIKEESIKEWRLGYAPSSWQGLSDFLVGRGYKREEVVKAGLSLRSEKNQDCYDRFRSRIMFPVSNLSSQVIGFGGRIFKEIKRPDGSAEAKYVNTPATILYDKSGVLYGLNKAGLAIRKKGSCVLVEGYVDAIMTSQAGFTNVVATSGTALTQQQLKILKRYSRNLLLAFDMDIAGDSATKRGVDLAQSLGFDLKIVTMPQGSDPADIVSEDPKKWEDLVKGAKTIHDFYFSNALSQFDKNTLEGKKAISNMLLPIIKKVPNRIEKSVWIQDLAEAINVKEGDVAEELEKTKDESIRIDTKTEAESPVLQKSRKELLEEHLLVLAIKEPKSINILKQEDLEILSAQTCDALNYLKNKTENDLPEELSKIIDYLSMKADFVWENEKELDSKAEFQNCLREIRAFDIKNKLNKISFEIKKAEQEKDFNKLQQLMKEFALYSKSRNDLETF